MRQQQQLGACIDSRALPGTADEGPADFKPPVLRGDGAEAGRSGDAALLFFDDRERQGATLAGLFEGDGDEVVDRLPRLQRLRKPARQVGADREFRERIGVARVERLQPDERIFQRERRQRLGEARLEGQFPPRSASVPSLRRSAFSLMKPSASFWL
jgi:hypothetical protein